MAINQNTAGRATKYHIITLNMILQLQLKRINIYNRLYVDTLTILPITKVKSKEDKELQELEVESTGGGMGAGGG
jgi:hypothetical protein